MFAEQSGVLTKDNWYSAASSRPRGIAACCNSPVAGVPTSSPVISTSAPGLFSRSLIGDGPDRPDRKSPLRNRAFPEFWAGT